MKPLLVVTSVLVMAGAALAADSTDPRIDPSKADQARAAELVLRIGDLGAAWSGGAEKPTSLKIPICPSNQAARSKGTGIARRATAVSSVTLDRLAPSGAGFVE